MWGACIIIRNNVEILFIKIIFVLKPEQRHRACLFKSNKKIYIMEHQRFLSCGGCLLILHENHSFLRVLFKISIDEKQRNNSENMKVAVTMSLIN